MKRLLLALGIWIAPLASVASQITNPHVFVNGETLNAANLNAPFNVLYAWANGSIDNTNIGPAGIWASQISAGSTAEATFSSSFGFLFTSSSTAAVPLTIVPAQGTTANQLVVDTTSGGVGLSVDASGNLTAAAGKFSGAVSGSQLQSTTNVISGSGAYYTNAGATRYMYDNGTTFSFTGPLAASGYSGGPISGTTISGTTISGTTISGSTGTFGTSVSAPLIASTGLVTGTGHALTNGAYLPAAYQASGASVGASVHIVFASATVTPGGGTATINLSGNAAFTSALSYACSVEPQVGSGFEVPLYVDNISGTQFVIVNAYSASLGVAASCVGY